MTNILLILGDSLVDSGNIASLLSPFGINPFEDKIYNGGGNVRASNGLVLGEQIALQMGADLSNSQLFTVLSRENPTQVDIHNYSHGGAKSDFAPELSIPFVLEVGIGLQEQKRQVLRKKRFYKKQKDVDILLSAGGNDLLDALGQIDEIKAIIATEETKDDKAFAKSISKAIANNIKKMTNKLDEFVDEFAILVPNITETPKVKDWITNFPKGSVKEVNSLLRLMETKLQSKTKKKHKDSSNVVVIDIYDLWNQLPSPTFIDSHHPDTLTSSQLASLFVSRVVEELDTFGF